jgi:chromosome segregation ATPase
VDTGDIDICISSKIAAKLASIQQSLEKELEEIGRMNQWTPQDYSTKNKLLRAAKQIRSTPESMRISFLSKIYSFRSCEVTRMNTYYKAANKENAKLKSHMMKIVNVANLTIEQMLARRQKDYSRWRSKRDYRIDQENRLNIFIETMDSNALFMFSRILNDIDAQIVGVLKYLRYVNIQTNIRLSRISVILKDEYDDVALNDTGRCHT